MDEFPLGGGGKEEVLLLAERVGEAQREAMREVKETGLGGDGKKRGKMGRGGKRDREDERDRDDDSREAGMPTAKRGKSGGRGRGRGR